MKKLNFENSKVPSIVTYMWLVMVFLCCNVSVQAQGCVLSVNQMTNVSLDDDCEAIITPDMVGSTSGCPGGDFEVILTTSDGVVLPDNAVGMDHINETLTVSVVDNDSGNSSWGFLLVEDKLDPVIVCPPSDIVRCFELEEYTPVATDNCGIEEIIVTNISDVPNPCGEHSFGADVIRRVTRTYVAVDKAGRTSEPCTVVIDILRLESLTDITPPDHLLAFENTNLHCEQSYEKLPNGHPAPTPVKEDGTGGSGAPLLFGTTPIYPAENYICNLVVDFEDQVLPEIACVTKIMRTWTIYEWSCDSPQRSYSMLQMIEIADTEGPVFECPGDLEFSTNSHDCEATVLLPSVNPTDNCDDNFTYNITFSQDGFPLGYLDTNGGLAQLPVGTSLVQYLVYDECGNPSDTCRINVTVGDNTPPVAICDLHTTVSLTNTGYSKVPATVFDDGSYDECEFDRVLVRRMSTTCPDFPLEDGDDPATSGFDDLFFEDIHFCCEDLENNPIMVVMRAYDKEGNYNDCMVEVQVQDKIAPSILCPADTVVNCTFAYDSEDLSTYFGTATSTGSCAGLIPTETANFDNLNQCNVGYITRTFTVSNAGGTATCTQTITFDPIDEFDENDIEWPGNITMTGCLDPDSPEFHPDATGYPTYTDDGCELVGANWEDEVYSFNNTTGDACFKIIRTWKVIDWCQFTTGMTSSHPDYPEWEWTQVIKVNDDEKPEITSSCDRISACTYDDLCASGTITLTSSASDNCTEDLTWIYKIDADNDGVYESGSLYNGSGVGNVVTITDQFPVGSHKIKWEWTDRCGNVTACEQLFDIVNCKNPTPYCIDGLALSLSPIDEDGDGTIDYGSVSTWASDFDAGSVHPCGYQVYFSFEEVTELNDDNTPIVVFGREFTCDDLGEQEVDIYVVVVTPDLEILQDYCTATLDIQDNQDSCPMNRAEISGNISTPSNEMVENVAVELQGSDLPYDMTDVQGMYAFPEMDAGGNYVINPAKNDDYVNGVNTLDLVLIQRHILNIQHLDSPYKIIAADITNDDELKPSDLLALRKLILGLTTEFDNNGSWKFIDKAYNFIDATDPLSEDYPTDYVISPLQSDMEVDFVAVKIGDVTEDANVTGENEIQSRSAKSLTLAVDNVTFNAGETVSLPIMISHDVDVIGAQFTLDFDVNALEIVSIESNEISLDENNLGFAHEAKGSVTFSWNDVDAVSFKTGDVFGTLILQAKQTAAIANTLTVTNDVTRAEAYDANLEKMNVDFNIEGRENNGAEFAVYQNRPNPFSDITTIKFDLPTSADVKFTIYDVTGKVVKSTNRNYIAGSHNIVVDENEITGSGIYYYTIKAGEYSATKKMVLID